MNISLHTGPNGEPEGGSFVGTFEREEVVYLGAFLGPRGYSKFMSGGHGPYDPIWGTKGSLLRLRCIGAERPRTQLLIYC